MEDLLGAEGLLAEYPKKCGAASAPGKEHKGKASKGPVWRVCNLLNLPLVFSPQWGPSCLSLKFFFWASDSFRSRLFF